MKKLAEEGNRKAAYVLEFIENSSKFLSTIQVGVTISGFLSSAIAANSFAIRIVTWITRLNPPMYVISIARTGSVIVITFILSYISLVFGELIPKKIAMNKAEKIALKSITPLRISAKIFSPFIWFLTVSVNGVLKLFGINPNDQGEEFTEEEILLMVSEGQEKGVIGNEESVMISNVLLLDDKTASDIMTHRTEVTGINIDSDYKTVLDIVVNERYSRFPVYEEKIDNIVGLIHIKDLLFVEDEKSFNIRDIMRPPCFVPESQMIDEVFKILKNTASHMAIVVDEYGGTAGIRDEYDIDEEEKYDSQIVSLEDNVFLIDGLTELDDLNAEFNLKLPIDEYDTVGGFAVGQLGALPEENTCPSFEFDNLRFTVEGNNEKRITKVRMEFI